MFLDGNHAARIAAHLRNQETGERMNEEVTRVSGDTSARVRTWLESYTAEQLRVLIMYLGLFARTPKAQRIDVLMAHYWKETVSVHVEIRWGHEGNGSYLAETKGVGAYYNVIEDRGNSFSGCPLGRGNTLEEAMADFVRRGASEYRGSTPLTLNMLKIVRTDDYRK